MSDVYVYADETGNLDYDTAGKAGASKYFGFGTATFRGPHGEALMEGLALRADLTRRGLNLQNGFHAQFDSHSTRDDVFAAIAKQGPRFDATLLYKPNAYERVRAEGEMRLYKMAWFLHLKHVAKHIAQPGDRVIVVAGSFGTKARADQARAALADVCEQMHQEITLCVWDSGTSWGLQVADYGLWAVQRKLTKGSCAWYDDQIKPTLVTEFFPWGRHDA